MSSNLYWQIVPPPQRHCLPKAVKFAFEKRYGHFANGIAFGSQTDIAFLEGIRDMSGDELVSKAVQELLDALGEHGEIRIWIE